MSLRQRLGRVSAILGDLQRRRVFRLAVLYLAGGWFLIQAADITLPTFGWGEGAVRVIIIAVVIGFPIALVMGFFFDITSTGVQVTPPAVRDASVAVLPFTDMTPAGDLRWFCDGLAEEILNLLADSEGLRVAARTSSFAYRDADRDLREVTAALGVATVLEGSVRAAGRFYRVTAQLIRADDGCHLLSRTYTGDLENASAFEQEVARSTAVAVRRALLEPAPTGAASAGQPVGTAGALSPELVAAVDEARVLVGRRSAAALNEARTTLEDVLRREPDALEARVVLAETLALLADIGAAPRETALSAAAEHASSVLEQEPDAAAAHAVLGFTRLLGWQWPGTERHFVRSIELEDVARTRQWYSMYLTAAGRIDDAIEQAETAVSLSPGSATARAGLAGLYYYGRRFEDAKQACDAVLALEPADVYTLALLGLVHEQRGEPELARMQLKAAVTAAGAPQPFLTAALARTYAAQGSTGEANRLLRLVEGAADADAHGFVRAAVHAALDDLDAAFACLELARQAHDGWLLALQVHPWLDPLRADARYGDLVARLGWGSDAARSGSAGSHEEQSLIVTD